MTQSGNVSVTQTENNLHCTMSLDKGKVLNDDFFSSPKVEQIINDGPEELRNIFGELKTQWQGIYAESRSSASA